MRFKTNLLILAFWTVFSALCMAFYGEGHLKMQTQCAMEMNGYWTLISAFIFCLFAALYLSLSHSHRSYPRSQMNTMGNKMLLQLPIEVVFVLLHPNWCGVWEIQSKQSKRRFFHVVCPAWSGQLIKWAVSMNSARTGCCRSEIVGHAVPTSHISTIYKQTNKRPTSTQTR